MRLSIILLLICFFTICQQTTACGQSIGQSYSKTEVQIPMRDGVKLHTTIYQPRDKTRSYPILLNRTPYSSQPYGANRFPGRIGPSKYLEQSGFIFVKQDVRGRWMSQGNFDNMRPNVAGEFPIDESSDTHDTIDWLLKNIPGNNGKVGMWGISYPGFYTAAALPDHHPALVAASPQAPISDFYFDDFHHHGAYLLSYFLATSTFGYQHNGPQNRLWYRSVRTEGRDAWNFYLNMIPVAEAYQLYGRDNFFWRQLVEHPNYDEFWQRRNILPHLKNIKANVMTVGGWFDAEDLYGPLNIYREIEKQNPNAFNTLVMGPWSHGDWSRRNQSKAVVGNISFGENLSDFYQKNIEAPFFLHFLKNEAERPKFEAMVYDCGKKVWRVFKKWPPTQSESVNLFLRSDGQISTEIADTSKTPPRQFVSDPNNPVPFRKKSDIKFRFTPRPYMSDDQRFASQRSDVLVFETEPLKTPVTLTGEISAVLNVSTTGTGADWVVKLIDVYPNNYSLNNSSPTGADLDGYQQLVRSEVMRGRYREGYESPKPFSPNAVTKVTVPLQDVFHTFRPGHRIMVQIQSSWFPLIDRNPQTYVENIFKAERGDYVAATHTVYTSREFPSYLKVRLLRPN